MVWDTLYINIVLILYNFLQYSGVDEIEYLFKETY